jgi:hypothetical protein
MPAGTAFCASHRRGEFGGSVYPALGVDTRMEHLAPILGMLASIAVIVGVCFGYLQLRKISISLALTHQANTANVVAHCATRYEKLIRDLPERRDDPHLLKNWWYRYWDLYTEQFAFFQKSILDPDIYELWINELATVYTKSPAPGLQRRCDNHQEYLQTTLPNYHLLHRFFAELRRIACTEEGSAEERARQVHKLVEEFRGKARTSAIPPNKPIPRSGTASR